MMQRAPLSRLVKPGWFALCAGLLVSPALPAAAAQASMPPQCGSAAVADLGRRLQEAWGRRDLDAYRALWDDPSAEGWQLEAAAAEVCFGSETCRLSLLPRAGGLSGSGGAIDAQVFAGEGPLGGLIQSRFLLGQRGGNCRIAARREMGRIDGLMRLSLDPQGYRMRGHTLRLADFELHMKSGTLFTSPQEVGPTALVFVGDGEVRITPSIAAEREQLRRYGGKSTMVRRVGTAFIRIHPGDLGHVLEPTELELDPASAARLAAAEDVFKAQAPKAYLAEVGLPDGPWHLTPAYGDALVVFPGPHRRPLTFSVMRSEVEDVRLVDWERRVHILLYASSAARASVEPEQPRVDIVDHALRVRFDPSRQALAAEDAIHVRLRDEAGSVRLRLDDRLAVESVSSPQHGPLLFFRLRNQDTLVVLLPDDARVAGSELTMTVRYKGALEPLSGNDEAQMVIGAVEDVESVIPFETVLVYTSRDAWYPRAVTDDYATATVHIEVPRGENAVSGGERLDDHIEGALRVIEYRQVHPVKYLSVVISHLEPAGELARGPWRLRAWSVPRLRGDGPQTLARTADILDMFAREFGPNPYSTIEVVLTEDKVPGGHSPAGLILLRHRPAFVKGQLRDDPASFQDVPGFFLAHELAHQWFGQLVSGSTYRERWLVEGAAQFAAALWVGENQGPEYQQRVLRRMGEWARRFNDWGPLHLGNRLGHVQGNDQAYRALVYDKGAYVMHMLRALVGPEAFRAGIHSYFADHSFDLAGTEDLQSALEASSHEALDGFFQQWVYSTELPSLRYAFTTTHDSKSGYSAVVQVEATELRGPLPLTLSVRHALGTVQRQVQLGPHDGHWEVGTPGAPSRVEINADATALTSRIERP